MSTVFAAHTGAGRAAAAVPPSGRLLKMPHMAARVRSGRPPRCKQGANGAGGGRGGKRNLRRCMLLPLRTSHTHPGTRFHLRRRPAHCAPSAARCPAAARRRRRRCRARA